MNYEKKILHLYIQAVSCLLIYFFFFKFYSTLFKLSLCSMKQCLLCLLILLFSFCLAEDFWGDGSDDLPIVFVGADVVVRPQKDDALEQPGRDNRPLKEIHWR